MWFRHCLLLACLFLPLRAEADISFSKVIHFKIRSEGGKQRLSSNVSFQQTFISSRSLQDTTFEISEYPHATISNIRAEFRGEALDSRRISFFYPQARDVFIDSARIHKIDFPPGLKPGEGVSVSYEEEYEDLAFFPMIRIPALERVSRFELVVDHPAGWQVDFSLVSARDALNPVISRSNATRTSMVLDSLPVPQALFSDPFKRTHGWVVTKITRDGAPQTPCTPEAFTSWYLGLLAPTSIPDEAMKRLLADELGRASSQREKARILFDYVKTHVRYIADEGSGHAFLPHPCTEVLDKKWGDCKDKARLLSVLARIHGIPIHMALLSTRPAPEFKEVSLGLFNHAICVLDDGGELFFMDPTAPQSELGDPPDSDLLARALVLDPANPRYAVIPVRSATPDVDLNLQGNLSSLKTAKATVLARHSWRTRILQARKELNDKDFEKYVVERFERILPKLPLSRFQVRGDAREELTLEAEANLSDFLVVTDVRVYAPTAPFKPLDPEFQEREKDAFPLGAPGPSRYGMELRILGSGLPSKPESVLLGEEGGPRHTASASGTAGEGRITYRFEQPFKLVPPGSRAAFVKFCADYARSSRQLFIFERSAP